MPSSSRRRTSRQAARRAHPEPAECLSSRCARHALHTHPEGHKAHVEAALAWVRDKLYADQPAKLVNDAISFEAAKLSRADVHID